MADLFKKRVVQQQKRFAKYIRLIFNDHFVLVVFFLFGGLLYFYSGALATIQPAQSYLLGLVLIFWWGMLQLGKLATLAEPADSYFLLPKEGQMGGYLKQAFKHSLWLPGLLLLAANFVAAPLILVLKNIASWQLLFFVIELWALKSGSLLRTVQSVTLKKAPLKNGWWQGIQFLILALSLWVAPFLGALLSLLTLAFWLYPLLQKETPREFSWELFVALEQKRLKRLYQLVAVFTDVPEIKNAVKRRKVFDPLLKKIKTQQRSTFLYLYARRFLRGGEYGSLFLSVTSFGMVVIVVLQNFYWVLGGGVLFLYLLGFQLIPLAKQFDYMTLTKLYPIAPKVKTANFLFLLKVVLLAATLCFVAVSLFVLSPLHSFYLFVALTLENFLFCYFYAPKRLSTMA